MKEQLSGACTVEIAAFDEFTKLINDQEISDLILLSRKAQKTKYIEEVEQKLATKNLLDAVADF